MLYLENTRHSEFFSIYQPLKAASHPPTTIIKSRSHMWVYQQHIPFIITSCHSAILPSSLLHNVAACMKHRSRSDIISEILDTANDGGATKTKIMYKVGLSHNQLKEYLLVLMDKDLLNYNLRTNSFKTTEKGLKFIESYNQMVHLMDVPEFGYDSDEKFRQSLIY